MCSHMEIQANQSQRFIFIKNRSQLNRKKQNKTKHGVGEFDDIAEFGQTVLQTGIL